MGIEGEEGVDIDLYPPPLYSGGPPEASYGGGGYGYGGAEGAVYSGTPDYSNYGTPYTPGQDYRGSSVEETVVVTAEHTSSSHTSTHTHTTSTAGTEVDNAALATSSSIFFHVLSICCCILSLIFWPFEIIPAVCIFLVFGEIIGKAHGVSLVLCICDLVITVIVAIISTAAIVICAVFSYGVCALALVFIIPYIVVACACVAGITGTTFSMFRNVRK
eukprot:TRINITY_DN558_c0_g1_i1.p1 TRINITY_DN558_c0_g1~~TRINITY_DN558_c0_g1_i1.p1  ORF type:complete len:218 (-),score=78.33 TRINITY_DN558_c0_g1_i1:19-672(-)